MKLNQAQFAKKIKVSAPRVNQLVKEGIIKLDSRGLIDFDKAMQTLRDSEHPAYPRGIGRPAQNKEHGRYAAQTELAFYKAKLAELDYRKRRGELIETEVAKNEWAKVMMLIVSRLEALPSKVAPLCDNQSAAEIAATLQEHIDQLRHEISDPATYGRKKKGAKK